MAFKVVNSKEDIQTRKKGFFSKKDVVAEKDLPNLQEILMLILNRESMRAVRLDTSLELLPQSYVSTRSVGDIVGSVMLYENQHKQNDRMYIISNEGLDKNARDAIEAKTTVDASACKTWKDFARAYEKVQTQSKHP